MPLISYRRDFPQLPADRLVQSLTRLAGDDAPGDSAQLWLRGDRLGVIERFERALGCPALGWCQIGLPGTSLSDDELLELAGRLSLGSLAAVDLRAGYSNAVHIPLLPFYDLSPRPELGGPWSLKRQRRAQVWYQEEAAGAVPSERKAARRSVALWTRDQFRRGRCPTPDEVRAQLAAGRRRRGGGSAALAVPADGLAPLGPLLRAWLALIEERSRIDLLWAARRGELEALLRGRVCRRSSHGSRWFGLSTVELDAERAELAPPPPPAEAVWKLLRTLPGGPISEEVDALSARFDAVGWDLSARLMRPGPGNRLSVGRGARGSGWVAIDIAVWSDDREVIRQVDQWIWRRLPGAGSGQLSLLPDEKS